MNLSMTNLSRDNYSTVTPSQSLHKGFSIKTLYIGLFTVPSSVVEQIFLSSTWISFTLVLHEQFLCFLLENSFFKMQFKIGLCIIHRCLLYMGKYGTEFSMKT